MLRPLKNFLVCVKNILFKIIITLIKNWDTKTTIKLVFILLILAFILSDISLADCLKDGSNNANIGDFFSSMEAKRLKIEYSQALSKVKEAQREVIAVKAEKGSPQLIAAIEKEVVKCLDLVFQAKLELHHWVVKADLYNDVDLSKLDLVNYKKYLSDSLLITDMTKKDAMEICLRFKDIISRIQELTKVRDLSYNFVVKKIPNQSSYSSDQLYEFFYENHILKKEINLVYTFIKSDPDLLKKCTEICI